MYYPNFNFMVFIIHRSLHIGSFCKLLLLLLFSIFKFDHPLPGFWRDETGETQEILRLVSIIFNFILPSNILNDDTNEDRHQISKCFLPHWHSRDLILVGSISIIVGSCKLVGQQLHQVGCSKCWSKSAAWCQLNRALTTTQQIFIIYLSSVKTKFIYESLKIFLLKGELSIY